MIAGRAPGQLNSNKAIKDLIIARLGDLGPNLTVTPAIKDLTIACLQGPGTQMIIFSNAIQS